MRGHRGEVGNPGEGWGIGVLDGRGELALYVPQVWPTREAAAWELADLLMPYPPGDPWRSLLCPVHRTRGAFGYRLRAVPWVVVFPRALSA